MFADTPSVVPFTFAVYDLSGYRIGPVWERFVHCRRRKAGDLFGETLDLDDLLEQAETVLDCIAIIDNYTTHTTPVWNSGFYITHTIPEWGAEHKPAVLRATPALSWRQNPGLSQRGVGVGGTPDTGLPAPA